MKDMQRAIRRHHVARLKRLRRGYHSQDLSANPKWIGRVVQTPQLCSCRACGNQRHWEGRTRQEQRGLLNMAEQMEELAP